MSDSDSSGLSSAPEEEVKKLAPIFQRAKKATKKAAPPPKASPPRPKRAPSPPHEDTFADNPDIAVRLRPYKTRNGALVTRVSRPNLADMVNTDFLAAVHRYVQILIFRALPYQACTPWPSGSGERSAVRYSDERGGGNAMRIAGFGAEPQEACRVRISDRAPTGWKDARTRVALRGL